MKRIGLSGLIAVGALAVSACEQSATTGDGNGVSNGAAVTTQPATEPGVTLNDVKRKTQDAMAAAAEYARQKKEEYQRRMEPELEALERRLEKLKERFRLAGERARPEIQKRVKDLNEMARKAREEFEQLRAAGDERWEDAQKRLDETMRQLEEALKEGVPIAHPTTLPTTRPNRPHVP